VLAAVPAAAKSSAGSWKANAMGTTVCILVATATFAFVF
jgi:hypothetical protein